MHLIHVVGARPNFMKVAPILRRASEMPGWTNRLVHTGQHYDGPMSETFFKELQIPSPEVNLGIGSGPHGQQTGRILEAFEQILFKQRPDLVVVVGDVNSTLACALAACKLHVPVAHVEAGLRSGDRRMPEEINRVLTDQIADLCLTPSRDAHRNLAREGIPPERIHFVGNVMIDTLAWARAQADELMEHQEPPDGAYLLVTLHRPSNVDQPETLRNIVDALRAVAKEHPVIWPVHPRTRARLSAFAIETGDLDLLPPVSYFQMVKLQQSAALVVTDSGGIQEETSFLGVPCVTLRSSTERPVTIEQGTNTLVPDRNRAAVLTAIRTALKRDRGGPCTIEGWDGRAAERIVDAIETLS